jgi:hypothetical protein
VNTHSLTALSLVCKRLLEYIYQHVVIPAVQRVTQTHSICSIESNESQSSDEEIENSLNDVRCHEFP